MKLRIEKPSWLDRLDDEDYSAFMLWFDSEVEPVNKVLEAGTEVYSNDFHGMGAGWFPKQGQDHWSHRALLINVQEIKKETPEDLVREIVNILDKHNNYTLLKTCTFYDRAKKALGEL